MMRFSELEQDEEFDNAGAFATWHLLFETGISQMKDYVQRLKITLNDKNESKKIPEDQKSNINSLISKFSMFKDELPIDSPENIRIIRNYLRNYNQSLAFGILMYDFHRTLLNGRIARNRQGRREVIEVTKTILQRDYEIELGNGATDDRSLLRKILRLPAKSQ
jgi:hypothetical protein